MQDNTREGRRLLASGAGCTPREVGDEKLPAVEDARAIMTEGMEWGAIGTRPLSAKLRRRRRGRI